MSPASQPSLPWFTRAVVIAAGFAKQPRVPGHGVAALKRSMPPDFRRQFFIKSNLHTILLPVFNEIIEMQQFAPIVCKTTLYHIKPSPRSPL